MKKQSEIAEVSQSKAHQHVQNEESRDVVPAVSEINEEDQAEEQFVQSNHFNSVEDMKTDNDDSVIIFDQPKRSMVEQDNNMLFQKSKHG